MYSIGELFAGIGGFSLAFHATGQARTAWFVEKAEFPQKVLRKNFPGVPVHSDIYDCHDLPYVDVITAGFPCQPFSVAGKRAGEKDERYLVPEMFRVIREVQPRVVFFENVPGFASIADGDTIKQFLRALAEMGFDAQWGHLAASDVGAPHKRERWFCVAYRQNDGLDWRQWQQVDARQSQRRRRPRTTRNGRIIDMVNASGANGEKRRTNRMGAGEPDAGFTCPGELGHAHSNRQPKVIGICQGKSINSDGTYKGPAQPRLGRSAPGLPARLDGHRWPARPGQSQHDWEPPRVTTRKDDRANRLRALGNAVVPQVIYPIAQSICEWLAAQDVAAEKVG